MLFYRRPHQDPSEPDQDKVRETQQTPEQVALCTDSACSCEASGGCLEAPPSCPTHSGAPSQFPEECCNEANAHWVCMMRNSLFITRAVP